MKDTLQRFSEYEKLGVRYIVQMDPEDRTTFLFVNGDLVRRDLSSFDVLDRGSLPFANRDPKFRRTRRILRTSREEN